MILLCSRCQWPLILDLSLDNEDKSKGLLVDQTWQGTCGHCKYEYSVRVIKKEVEDGKGTKDQ